MDIREIVVATFERAMQRSAQRGAPDVNPLVSAPPRPGSGASAVEYRAWIASLTDLEICAVLLPTTLHAFRMWVVFHRTEANSARVPDEARQSSAVAVKDIADMTRGFCARLPDRWLVQELEGRSR